MEFYLEVRSDVGRFLKGLTRALVVVMFRSDSDFDSLLANFDVILFCVKNFCYEQ